MRIKPVENRLELVQNLMRQKEFGFLAVNAGKDLKYLTGMDFHLSERPAVLIIPLKSKPVFIFPEFEHGKVESSLIDIEPYPYPENPLAWGSSFKSAVDHLGIGQNKIGVSPTSMRFLEIDMIQKATKHKSIISADMLFRDLYVIKNGKEIDAIRQAVRIAENAIKTTLTMIKPGIKESELANQIEVNLLLEGSEPDLPFHPIVASGPNSANPHAVPGNRELQRGDLLIIDWGARFKGYVSDITRTYSIGEVEEKFRNLSQVVLTANENARRAVQPGASTKEIDSLARGVIIQAGYGDYFSHRTGHGIGLEPHENPYISQSSEVQLQPGMVFTIEPGIYLPGKGGIRIEDNIAVTDTGSETLTRLPREILIL